MNSWMKRLVSLIVFCVLLSGCMVGPDFHAPPPPQVPRYTPLPIPAQTVSAPTQGGQAQHLLFNSDIPGEWWTLFHSPLLNDLIVEGLTQNPSIAAAEAAIRIAQENWRAQVGALLPAVNLNAFASRQHQNGASSINLGNSNTNLNNRVTPITPSTGLTAPNPSGPSSSSAAGSGSGAATGGGPSTFNVFSLSLQATYTLDLFGGIR